MPAHIQSKTTSRFLDPWPYISLLITGLMILALVSVPFWSRTLILKDVRVDPDEVVRLQPIQFQDQLVGALRIDATALIPTNTWVTYEIQLRDAKDQVLVSALKQAWQETGTWREEGETGTWFENDLQAGLDVRANRPEPLTVAIDVLEYTDTSGKEIDKPVPISIRVQNGVIDSRYLWAGLFGTGFLTLLTFWGVPTVGRCVIAKTTRDSDVGERAVAGGRNRLVRVQVEITADEYTPDTLTAAFSLKDGNGKPLFQDHVSVRMNHHKDSKGKVYRATGTCLLFLLLENQDSYGFYVEVHPDRSVDKTRLVVRERARTRLPVKVVQIS